MTFSTAICIDPLLYAQAEQNAILAHRSVTEQIEFWARVGRAALDNPDLPVDFIAESLLAMAESHADLDVFVPRSRKI